MCECECVCAYLRASLVERVRLFVVVVVVPGLLTPRNTLLEGGSLRVQFNFCLQKAHVQLGICLFPDP